MEIRGAGEMDKQPEVNSDFVRGTWCQGPARKCRSKLGSRGGWRWGVGLAQGWGWGGNGWTWTSWAGLCDSRVDSVLGLGGATLGLPQSCHPAAATMLPPGTVTLLTLLLAAGSLGQRPQRPRRPASPISTIQPKANFDAQQVEVVGGRGRNVKFLGRGRRVEGGR